MPHLRQIGGPILPAKSLGALFVSIGAFFAAHRACLMVIVAVFATGLTSGAFASERRAVYASGCVGCASGSDAVPPLYSDENYRGYVGGPFAYANPEADAVTGSYDGAPTQASPRSRVVHRTIKSRQVSRRSHGHTVEPRMKTYHHQAKRPVARVKKLGRRERPLAGNVRVASTLAALPVLVTRSRSAFNAAPIISPPASNVVVVNGRQVEIVSPEEINSIDLAADAVAPEQVKSLNASPTLLAETLSMIAGALAAVAVCLFLRGRSARISSLDSLPRHC